MFYLNMDIAYTITIILLIAYMAYKEHISRRERLDMQKMSKIKNVQDMEYVFQEPKQELSEENNGLIPLEDITHDDIVSENKEN